MLMPYHIGLCSITLTVLSGISLGTDAVDPGAGTPANIKVIIVAPPSCIVERNMPVDFDRQLNPLQTDGVDYQQDIAYTLDCGNTDYPPGLEVTRLVIVNAFTAGLLRARIAGRGIALLRGNNALLPNQPFMVLSPELPKLQAIPVRVLSAPLPPGDFTASVPPDVPLSLNLRKSL